jgi:hypothetical protein
VIWIGSLVLSKSRHLESGFLILEQLSAITIDYDIRMIIEEYPFHNQSMRILILKGYYVFLNAFPMATDKII